MDIEPHNMTTDELLRFHADSPLAPALIKAQEQLEQAGKALTAARSLQDAAEKIGEVLDLDGYSCMERLPAASVDLAKAVEVFTDEDDGELGA